MRYPNLGTQADVRYNIPTLNGGLNVADTPTEVNDNQLTECENVWFKDSELRTRPRTEIENKYLPFITEKQDVKVASIPEIDYIVASDGLSIGDNISSNQFTFSEDKTLSNISSVQFPEYPLVKVARDGSQDILTYYNDETDGVKICSLSDYEKNSRGGMPIHTPTVVMNGKGQSYGSVPSNEKTTYSPAIQYEGHSLLTQSTRYLFDLDGYSTSFPIPDPITNSKEIRVVLNGFCVGTQTDDGTYKYTYPYKLEITGISNNVRNPTVISGLSASDGKHTAEFDLEVYLSDNCVVIRVLKTGLNKALENTNTANNLEVYVKTDFYSEERTFQIDMDKRGQVSFPFDCATTPAPSFKLLNKDGDGEDNDITICKTSDSPDSASNIYKFSGNGDITITIGEEQQVVNIFNDYIEFPIRPYASKMASGIGFVKESDNSFALFDLWYCFYGNTAHIWFEQYIGGTHTYYNLCGKTKNASGLIVDTAPQLEIKLKNKGNPEYVNSFNSFFDCTESTSYSANSGSFQGGTLFFGGNGTNRVWYCNASKKYVSENAWFDVGDSSPVIGFGKQGGSLVIFKENSIWVASEQYNDTYTSEQLQSGMIVDVSLYGSYFPIRQVSNVIGCSNPKSIQLVNNRLIWEYEGEIYTLATMNYTQERNVYKISRNIDLKGRHIDIATTYRNYYLLFTSDINNDNHTVFVFNTDTAQFLNISSYLKSNAEKTQEWYKWVIPHKANPYIGKISYNGETYSGVVCSSKKGFYCLVLEQSQVAIYDIGFSDIVDSNGEYADEMPTIDKANISVHFQTKQFNFNAPYQKKRIRKVFTQTTGDGQEVDICYKTDRGDKHTIGTLITGEQRYLPLISGVVSCSYGLTAEGIISIGGITYQITPLREIK